MLEKPDFPDRKIIACLEREFELQIDQLNFLPVGGDLSTAVYQAVSEDNTAYFCKLKFGIFDETTVALPKFLYDQRIPQIIPPLTTQTGQLWAELEQFKLILYPFIEGVNGYEIELSESQWADFGTALKRIHTTAVPPALDGNIRKESFAPEWRARCKEIIQRLDEETLDEPVAIEWGRFLRPHRETILHMLRRAEQLANTMASRSVEFVLCHSDIHPGNLFIDAEGTLFIVVWDYPLLAPKERDLIFIGGGQGCKRYIAEQEEKLFYRGYVPSQIDPTAMAYYRYERGITDIVVESERVLSKAVGVQNRAQALEYLKLGFLPDSTVEMACKSDKLD